MRTWWTDTCRERGMRELGREDEKSSERERWKEKRIRSKERDREI